MTRFPGIGRRIQERLKTLGYWKAGRPDIARFCTEKDYRSQYLYAWLSDRVPGWDNLTRLALDLGVAPEWIMFGTGLGTPAQAPEAGDRSRVAPRAQIIDFARLREVTSRLVRLESELGAIFRAFPDFYFWLDDEGRFLAWQGGRGSEFHVAPDTMLGKKIVDVFPAEDAQALERGLHDAAASGGVVAVEFALGPRSYETRFLPLGGPPAVPQQLLMIIREITERKQAEEAASALARVGRELAGTLDPAKGAERMVSALHELFRVRRVGLFQLDPVSGGLVCVAIAGEGDRDKWLGGVVERGAGIVHRAIQKRRAVWARDVTAEPDLPIPPWLRERVVVEGYRSVAAVPLISRGEVLGALALAAHAERVFTPAELNVLSGFADAAALALQNARLYEEAGQRRDEAEVVADLARTISASLDLGLVLQAVVDGARDLCRCDQATIALREMPDAEPVVVRYWTGARNPHVPSVRIDPGEGLGGRVLASGRPFRTDDYAADPRLKKTKEYLTRAQAIGLVAALAVPILIDQRVEGLLYVHNGTVRPFSDRDEAVLARLAGHAAVAIRNARVYELSERRRSAAQALVNVGQLVTQSLDPDVVAQRIADSVLTLFGAKASAIFRLEPVFGDLLVVAVAGEVIPGVSAGLLLPAGIGVPSRAVRARRPFATPDFLRDPSVTVRAELGQALERLPHRSALAVPLLGTDGATGALVVWDRTGRRFDDEDTRFLQGFADHAARALENAQQFRDTERRRAEAQAAAAHSEQRFESLARGLTAIVWEADASTWQTLFVGQAAEKILGYSLERWYTEPEFWLNHLHLEDRERMELDRRAAPPADREREYRMIAADGRVVWFNDFVHVVCHEDGRTRWLHGAMVDITESKLAAEATRLLGDVARLLAQSGDRDAAARTIAEGVRRLFSAWLVTLYRMTPGTTGMITVARATDARNDFDWTRFMNPGSGVLGLAMRERRAAFSADILTDARLSYTPEVRAQIEQGRARAILGVPLIVRGAVVGALAIGDHAGRSFGEHEVRLAQAFADQAALALASEPPADDGARERETT